MKKIIIVLLSLLVLCGCSNSNLSHVSNGEEVLYEGPDGISLSKDELYQYEKQFDIKSALSSSLISKIAEKEGVNIKDIQKNAEDYIDGMIEQGYGEFVTYYYGSRDAYIKDSTNYEAKRSLLKKNIEVDFDEYLTKYEPFKASIVYFADEESANNVLTYLDENESTFAYACTLNGYSSEVSETVYTNSNTEIPSEVRTWINDNSQGVSPVIKVTTVANDSNGNSKSEDRYYLVNLLSKDVNTFKDEFVDLMTSEIDENLVINDLIKKHKVTVHDQDIFDALHSQYEAVK